MKAEKIVQRLIKEAEQYGCENAERIESIFERDIPRCAKCGRPYIVVDMAGTDCFFVGCPNNAHRDGDIQI